MKRWEWIFALVVAGIAIILVCLARLLPANKKPVVFVEVKKKVETYKTKAEINLKNINLEIEERKKHLAEILEIQDDDERMTRLAEFGMEKYE